MDQAGKTAVVYFSVSEHSKRAAEKLAKALDGDLIALRAPSYRTGVLGYMRAGFDSLRQKCDLAPQDFSTLGDYDRLVLCGPLWTSYPATPLRALLKSDMDMPETIGLFLTSGSHSPAEKAFATAEADLGRPLVVTAELGNSIEDTDHEEEILKRFVDGLTQSRDAGLRSVN